VKKEGLKSQIINVDLMAINKKQCAHSLKVLEGNLGLDLLECPVPFDKLNLTYNDMVQIILYNQEDVRATKAVFE
jgi:predicted RecB family nuclease